ncbi:ARID DNA-binding domain-containing protein, partial [Tanacetum coccineum]
MVNTSTYLEANWSYKPKGSGQNQQWYQSKSWKPLRKISQREFTQRKIKREKEERIGKCVRQITRSYKDMLKKKLEEVEAFNSSILQDKHKRNKYLLKQQGFEVVSEGDRYRLEYMFKEPTGNILDLNKLRQMQNNFLEDYFEGLNENKDGKKDEMVRIEEDMNSSEVHTFHEFVAFLNLIKNDELVSKGWDLYRDRFVKVLKWFYSHYLQRQLPGPIPPIIHGIPIHLFDLYKLIEYMGGYLSVHFGQEFGALAEILGLTRKDGEDIRKCYMVYLDIFISYYKTARAPEVPAKAEEDSSLESYQWNIGKTCAPLAVQKGKEKLEHFGIKLEEEEVCKEQKPAYYGNDQILT